MFLTEPSCNHLLGSLRNYSDYTADVNIKTHNQYLQVLVYIKEARIDNVSSVVEVFVSMYPMLMGFIIFGIGQL